MKQEPDKNRVCLKVVLGALAIIALTFIVYRPVLPGSFLMDDERLISSDNALVNGQFTPYSIWFRTDFTLTTFVWWLEHLAFGKSPDGYHVVNIILQAISALLLWRLLARMKIPGSWLAAALFAVHPVCVNSVARVAELKNTLSMPFFLLSFIAYVSYEAVTLYPAESENPSSASGKGTVYYVISLVAFVLALLAKTTVVMLPVVLLLCAFWQRRRIQWKDVLHTLPFFVLSLGFGLMSIWFQKHQALTTTPLKLQPESFGQRLAGAGYDGWFYVGKALFPFNLNVEYPLWKLDVGRLTTFLPDLFACALFFLCLVFRRSWGRHALFGLGCFVVMLFPALGFFDAQFLALWQVSDHLQYTALPAIVALVAAALAVWLNPMMFRLAAVVLLLGSSILCFEWVGAFKNQDALMADIVAKNPAAWGALNDLGVTFAEKGDYAKARDKFEQSVKYNPDNAEARANLGYALILQGNLAEAETQYLAALKNDPHEPLANKMYARLLEREGRNAQAIYHLQVSVIFRPDVDTYMDMASLDYATGHSHRAVIDLKQALALKPNPTDEVAALNNLAWILATCSDDSVRNGSEAVNYAEQVCRLTNFKQPAPISTLAAAYAEAGRFPEAISTAERAISLAKEIGDAPSAAACQRLLQLYQAGKPFRDKPSANGK